MGAVPLYGGTLRRECPHLQRDRNVIGEDMRGPLSLLMSVGLSRLSKGGPVRDKRPLAGVGRKDAGLYCGSHPREERSVCLCWAPSKPKGLRGTFLKLRAIDRFLTGQRPARWCAEHHRGKLRLTAGRGEREGALRYPNDLLSDKEIEIWKSGNLEIYTKRVSILKNFWQ